MTLLAVEDLAADAFGFKSEVAVFFLAAPTFVLVAPGAGAGADDVEVELAVAGAMAEVVSLLLLLFLLPLLLLLLLDGRAEDDEDEDDEEDGAWFTLTAPQPMQGISVLGIVRLHGMHCQDMFKDGAVGFLAAVEGIRQFFPIEEEEEEEEEEVCGL